jgi:hypothetical protein
MKILWEYEKYLDKLENLFVGKLENEKSTVTSICRR